MSTLPPPWDPSDDADEQYRRASGLDPSRPSEATRRAVLAHAARLAAARARRGRGWPSLAGVVLRWQAVVGTLAAAALAAVVIAPQFIGPRVPPESQLAPATVPPPTASREPAAAPAAQDALQKPALPAAAPPVPRDSASPAGAPVALARPAGEIVAAKAEQRADSRAAGATPAPARPASEAVTQLQGAESNAANALSEDVVASRNRLAAADRAAPAQRPLPADPDTLRRAAEAGDLAALRAQRAAGGDIDARDAQGRTALLLATVHGQTRAVAVLLADGADPNAADAQGTTPLQAAVAAGEREIVALLRRYGAR